MNEGSNNEKEIPYDTLSRSNHIDLSHLLQDSLKSTCSFKLPTILPFEILNDADLKRSYPENVKYLFWKFPTMASLLNLLDNKIEMNFPETYAAAQLETHPKFENVVDSSNSLPLFGIEQFGKYIHYCMQTLEKSSKESNRIDQIQSMSSHLLSIPHLEVEKTWSQYCSFVSEEFPDDYNEQVHQIKRLKSTYDKNRSFVDECITVYETKLSKHKKDREIWMEYLWKCRDSYLKESDSSWRFIKLRVILALFYRALFYLYNEGMQQISESEILDIVSFYSEFLKLLLNVYTKSLSSKTSGHSKKMLKNCQKENETISDYIIGVSSSMITSHENSLKVWLFYLNYINGLHLQSKYATSIDFSLIRIHLKNVLRSLISEKQTTLDLDSSIQLASFMINFEHKRVKSQETDYFPSDNSQMQKINSIDDSKMLEYLYEDIDWLVVANSEFFFDFDSSGRLLKLVIDILISLKDYDEARYVCESLISRSARKGLWVWDIVIETEKKMRAIDGENNREINEKISNLYIQAFNDLEIEKFTKCFIFGWINHEYLYGDNSFKTLKRKMCAERAATELLSLDSRENSKTNDELNRKDKIVKFNAQVDTKIDSNEGMSQIKKRSANDDDSAGDEPSHKKSMNHKNNQDSSRSTGSRNIETIRRDRENFTVKIQNLPYDINSEELKEFFGDCGDIIDLKIVNQTDGSSFAIMEFSQEAGFLAALTKTYKKIRTDKQPITVTKNENSTVYVSNFSSSETEDSLMTKFKQAGYIRSIRFPSLKYNMDRRFCYIEYSTNSEALSAIEKYHNSKAENSDYRLQVKLSDPENKQERSKTALETKREVFINNLDFFKVNQTKLTELFAKYGEIQRLNIPLSIKGKSFGRLNDGYAFITFKDAQCASMAVEKLNMVNFHGRVIEVSIASVRKPNKNHTKKVIENTTVMTASLDDINERYISILGLPDNINAQQLMNLLNQKVGKVIKLDLRALNGTALIEFETVDSAGKAGLLLNGERINGKSVTVGNKEDFFLFQKQLNHNIKSKKQITNSEKETINKKQPTETTSKNYMFVPTSVRRKKRSTINLKK